MAILNAHTLLLLTQLTLLSAPNFAGRRAILVTSIGLFTLWTHLIGPVGDDPREAQTWTLFWPVWLATLEKCITAGRQTIEEKYWRLDQPAREATTFPAFSLAKLKWAAGLLFNARLAGWNAQVKTVTPVPHTTKAAYLRKQAFKAAQSFLMADLALQLGIRWFWTTADDQKYPDSKLLTIRREDTLPSFVNALVFGCGPYFCMQFQYLTASVIAVGLNLSQPEDWPPLFGNITETTTVRAFWGQFWHQTLRRPLTTFGHVVTDFLRLSRRGPLAFYIHIWNAFLISGLLHAQSMALLPRPKNITLYESTAGLMYFFVWQALIITAEDIAQRIWIKSGRTIESLGAFRFVVGYTWVAWSLWVSLPWAADVMMRVRLTEESFLPFTIFGPWINVSPSVSPGISKRGVWGNFEMV
ncbi:hypothetical protein P154DRAFT_604173 [Amniculicola lignicola CBS 123094]|uniref:Wax synthase domain-containing protein n=1 Tax=Amniculicola lignicola CBS 123094 TaxID=1392246 RepID=A0A6A5WBR2_9PLEO|nr:hypothetical protein P154DRAFT_604173 [Amniculicola lignicola CBS 123094]